VAVDPTLSTLEIGKAQVIREGGGVAILNFGVLLDQAILAGEALGATVVDMRWVKPLDVDLLRSLASQHECFITLEENAIAGGAGSGVAEWLAESKIDRAVRHVGIPDAFIAHAGQGECRQLAGLTSDSIIAAAEGFAMDQISAPLSASPLAAGQNQQAL